MLFNILFLILTVNFIFLSSFTPDTIFSASPLLLLKGIYPIIFAFLNSIRDIQIMKSTYFYSLASILLLASCASGADKQNEGNDKTLPKVEFEGYRFDTVVRQTDADSLPNEGYNLVRVSGQGMIPVKIGNHDLTILRDSLEKIGGFIFTGVNSVEPQLEENQVITDMKPSQTEACGASHNELSVNFLTPQIVVWKDYAAYYICGAAHGSYRTTYLNFSLSEGKILSIADLMRPGYEEELSQLLREKIQNEKIDLLIPISEVGIPDNFEITADGIRFVYGLYDIAPYAAGEIYVDFDAYELEEILTPESLRLIAPLPD